jgi:hypothetical protein
VSDFRQPEDNKETTMTNPNSLAGESGYSKPFPLSMTAISLSPLMIYRLVAGVLTGLVVIYGLALATAINSLFAR